jgi:cytochrome b pre-mRNA-processing protein 3
MPWPFGRRKSRPPVRAETIESIYGMIVTQARLPDFYIDFGVPDTVDGRFDMVVLHLWMILRQLRAVGAPEAAQALFDHFCGDMDANLREMGVGDFAVPKRMTKFGEAFYGRSAAYDAAVDAGGAELAAALARNILLRSDAGAAAPLADYVSQATATLSRLDQGQLMASAWRFPSPATRAERYAS